MTENDFQPDEAVAGFVSECREMIDEVEPILIELGDSAAETGVTDEETSNLIFRLFHSIKGTAGFLQFDNLVKVTHEAETLLDIFRSEQAHITARETDVLCQTCDIVGLMLVEIESKGTDVGFESQVEAVINKLRKIIRIAREGDSELSTEETEVQKDEPPLENRDILFDEINNTASSDAESMELILTPDMIERFVGESDELLEKVEESLLILEKAPDNHELIEEAFRSLHSFKGNCGFFGYADLETISHKSETVLEVIKEGEIPPDGPTIQALLLLIDSMRQAVADISEGHSGKIQNSFVLLDMLDDILPDAKEDDHDIISLPEIEQPEAIWALRKDTPPQPPLNEPKDDSDKKKEASTSVKSRSISRQDIRVNLPKLDQLINLVGELVIASTMVIRNPDLKEFEFENFERSAGHLDKIIRELQDMTLAIRMIPISGVFRKMIRLVHDLSGRANKKVNLKLSGEDTEIDKTVSELIADPLVHLVRNAIDHGLESPEERKSLGKDEPGEILLEAKHEGGEIWITIKDDGKGIDKDDVLAKGFQQGLLNNDGSNMTDQEVFELIFHPGFSTAEKVTDISGRGVGMDVVKKNIEKIKGRIDIRSEPGKGTAFILRIPLTLAIIEGMLVRVGKARYTIPLLSIRESIQINADKVTITMDGQELVNVRNELIPIIRIHTLHNVQPDFLELHEGLLVIVENQGETAGLFIDEIIGEQQAVIKGLSNYIGNVKGVSGCTILGDGEVSLILDIGGLISKAHGKSTL